MALQQVWQSGSAEIQDASRFKELEKIRAWGREAHSIIRKYLATVDEKTLFRHVEFPWKEQLLEHFGEIRPTRNLFGNASW
jgi:hypothetical protein